MATFTPPIPLSTSPKVKSKLTSKGTVSNCVGGGVTAGTTTFVQTSASTAGNCSTIISPDPKSKGTLGTLTIVWKKGSAAAGKSVAKGFKVKQTNATTATTTGKITSGKFVGKLIVGTVTFKPKDGNCANKPLHTATYTNKTGTKFVIK